MSAITVCIFSFNRAQYLRNCIDSIRNCLTGADILIFDDNSDDTETLELLNSLKKDCRVIKPKKLGTIKHGGLYHNMNLALDLLNDTPLACFLQDDTQLVRPIDTPELHQIQDMFDRNPTLGFIHPCFIRGIDLKRRKVTPLPASVSHFFYRQDTGQSAGIHYSDLVIFEPKRLIEAGWHFQQSEPANDQQAKKLFGMMAYMWLPIAMWLPEVPAYRGKKKTLGLRLAEKHKQVGFYPFEILSISKDEYIQKNEMPKLPIAEEFLTCQGTTPPAPWTYNPLTGLTLYKHVNNIEIFIRRWLKQ
ncbi:glycosyltransferase [Vreelandella aquamarina]|uniref:glycosyltransferase family 2 protein n=1 Tax=Vreelandella aquamarina TaxID=77097 RepID=UPI0038506C99